jgi:hypothetical protein
MLRLTHFALGHVALSRGTLSYGTLSYGALSDLALSHGSAASSTRMQGPAAVSAIPTRAAAAGLRLVKLSNRAHAE